MAGWLGWMVALLLLLQWDKAYPALTKLLAPAGGSVIRVKHA
ncbi:MAG TPA: hypothetical protein QF753_22855 [Victivallales bacterium]|nr:hypothetical protein [Victivallales bacterium]